MITAFVAVAANRVILDALNNSLSAIDILAGLQSQSFPLVVPTLTLLFCLKRDNDDAPQKQLKLIGFIDDKEIFSTVVDADFHEGLVTRCVIGWDGFIIPNQGMLTMKLYDESREVGKILVPISEIRIPPPKPTNSDNVSAV